jgi:hypothetical protein
MSKLIECLLQSLKCTDNRKLIPIDSKRVAVTVPRNSVEKGKMYLVVVALEEYPLFIGIKRCIKIGSSLGFLITSSLLRKLANLNHAKVKICIASVVDLPANQGESRALADIYK